MKIERFEDIEAWKKARDLTRQVYAFSEKGKFGRDYSLKDQIRRASGSVMHNIAEGFDAGSNPEFIRFLFYAKRSSTEVQSELYIALDQSYISKNDFENLYSQAKQTRSQIGAFIKYLSNYESKRKARSTNREP